MKTLLALVLCLLLSAGLRAAAPPLAKRELLPLKHPASGHILGGRLYALRVYKQSVVHPWIPRDHSPPDLVCIPIDTKALPPTTEQFRLGGFIDQDTWCRWRISQGSLWWAGLRPTIHAGLSEITMDALRNEKSPLIRGLFLWQPGLQATPLSEFSVAFLYDKVGARELFNSPWDVLPGPMNSAHLFFCWRGELLIWKGRPRPGTDGSAGPEVWAGPREMKRKGFKTAPLFALKTELKEQYLAHTDGKDFFLVSASGKVYRLHEQGKKWQLDLVWNDKARPVRLLVTDSKKDRTFAFAHSKSKPTKETPDVYFPLSGKIVPVALERDKASPASARDNEAALLAAARLLIKKGEIKDKR